MRIRMRMRMRKWVMDEFLISDFWYLISDFKIKPNAYCLLRAPKL